MKRYPVTDQDIHLDMEAAELPGESKYAYLADEYEEVAPVEKMQRKARFDDGSTKKKGRHH